MEAEKVPLIAQAKQYVFCCLPCGKKRIGKFNVRVGKQIAEGGFSSVYVCTDLEHSFSYAMKKIIVTESEQIQNVKNEIEMHRRFDHPNLLRLLDYSEESQAKQKIYRLLFPLYARGSVGSVIDRMRHVGKIFSEEQALHLFVQTLSALNEMHTSNPPIAHHDIKPENILLSKSNAAVLMDFGSASEVRSYNFKTYVCNALIRMSVRK